MRSSTREALRSGRDLIYGEMFRGGTEAVLRNYRNLMTLMGTFLYREEQLLDLLDRELGEASSK